MLAEEERRAALRVYSQRLNQCLGGRCGDVTVEHCLLEGGGIDAARLLVPHLPTPSRGHLRAICCGGHEEAVRGSVLGVIQSPRAARGVVVQAAATVAMVQRRAAVGAGTAIGAVAVPGVGHDEGEGALVLRLIPVLAVGHEPLDIALEMHLAVDLHLLVAIQQLLVAEMWAIDAHHGHRHPWPSEARAGVARRSVGELLEDESRPALHGDRGVHPHAFPQPQAQARL
mmetsp:Transcript_67287/g.194625  ORF Transcript_67287/g.194625 Transcript_67287/m.194625 type:complete len:228 (+) Transcript_67287:2362-3045(+)